MSNLTFETKITEIVCEIAEKVVTEINPNAKFIEDLGLDSLRALEVLAAIENEYSITIDPDRLQEMTTLNNVIKVTSEYLH